MTCRMPTTSEQFVPEKRLPQAGARDAEVPSLQAGSCARTTGQGVACQGMLLCFNPCTMDRNLCSNPLLGYFFRIFLKKTPTKQEVRHCAFLAVDGFHKGFLGAHPPHNLELKLLPVL